MFFRTSTFLVVAVAWLVGCTPANQGEVDVPELEAAVEQAAEPRPPCQLTFGFESWEPYQYLSVGGEVGGVDVEIAQRVANEIGCTLKAEQGSWMELLEWLQNGEIDFIMGASMTESRREYAHFSIPYRQEQFSLFVRAEELPRYTMDTIEEFLSEGYRMGVVNEYFYGDDLQGLMHESEYSDQFVGTILNEMNMARLLDADIDGFLEDNLVAASIIRRRGLSERIARTEIHLDSSDVYIMFSRSSVSESEIDAFNNALRTAINSGYIDSLIRRYGG
ncbi:substrate-binding periplasmic protein [Aliidiomarina haloalkalitolerans]|uniref:Amino acid ABC transporter substrate-binding protein n=1 Tax=Aliidiomarina haloalkalitolerans TaxID=859059 RepID=A0A432VR08_9GAMM|nr:transporter substrate-binding domain-containing protein [Aliidiomarina haloalkalitolerans]RUO18698.1 amino acid ABC transporter substrate-binding protein [Aliidiomarina haloalkalitolerans]